MLSVYNGLRAALLFALLGNRAFAQQEYPARQVTPQNKNNLCEVADSNIERAMDAILSPSHSTTPLPSTTALWDRKHPPKLLDRFERRFTLRPQERERLYALGFASLARLTFPSYTTAFHELYQSQLPLYVSSDAILHAVYASNDQLIADIEQRLVLPQLRSVIRTLRSQLSNLSQRYPSETVHDIDVYLTVAARLLELPDAALIPASEAIANKLVASAKAASELREVTLFGRARMIDFSQYTVRGHYREDPQLAVLFQAAMWLSRLELNILSRSSRSSAPTISPDPRETPREVVLALALADLAERSGAQADIASLHQAWTLLAGKREDVSIDDLIALRKQAGITDLRAADVTDKLHSVIGKRFARTVAVHYMPQGSTELPVIATLLGPRIPVDVQSIRPLVHDAIPDRHRLGIAEILFGLGHPRALFHLQAELQRFPSLRAQLDVVRSQYEALQSPHIGSDDLYSAWLTAVQGLAKSAQGVRPSFMEHDAYKDLRLNSTVAAFGQLKHNYVLMSGQGYELGGCEIPDGYVEPVPAVFDALAAYAQRGERVLQALDRGDQTGGLRYFQRLRKVLRVLSVIAQHELEGKPLGIEEKRFLSMVVELRPGSSSGPPTYTGWYFDLFRKRDAEGLSSSAFIADYYTSVNLSEASYVGVSAVRLGLFVIDVGGAPRIVTGPIARAFALQRPFGPAHPRLTDEAAAELPESDRQDPWATSYTVAAPTEVPALTLTYDPDVSPDIEVDAEVPLQDVTFALLDHHRQPLATLRRSFPKGKTVFRFPAKSSTGKSLTGKAVCGLSLRYKEFFFAVPAERRAVESVIHFTLGQAK
ncbi:MAG: DUF3160 domain-containing protein [Myxococcales bacterium]|nr:DUF3160 domain-containing protein [Myxococcales bacterium]